MVTYTKVENRQWFQPYIKDQRLCDFAEVRAPQVEKEIGDGAGHRGFHKMLNAGISYISKGVTISENIADDYVGEQDMLDVWIKSPEHLENLQKPLIYSCVKCYKTACSQIFSNF